MNIAIVGTNFISDRFAEAAQLTEGVTIGAVYSRGLDTGCAFARRHGIEKVYTSYSEMCNDSALDAVYIASPTMCHSEHAALALRAGLAVLCEKMICATYREFLFLDEVRRNTGGIIIEAMRCDFDRRLGFIKENLPRLGKIKHARLEYRQYSSRYDSFLSGVVLNAFDPKMKNSALADIGIYPLHYCVSLFGEPCSVSASGEFLSNGFLGSGEIRLDYGEFSVDIVYSKTAEGENVSRIEGEHGTACFDKINEPTYAVIYIDGSEIPFATENGTVTNNMADEISAFRDIVSGARNDAERLWHDTAITMKLVGYIYGQLNVDF